MAKIDEDLPEEEYIDKDVSPKDIELTAQKKMQTFPTQVTDDELLINGYPTDKKESGWNFENFSPSEFAINQINATARQIEAEARLKELEEKQREEEFQAKLGHLLPRAETDKQIAVQKEIIRQEKTEGTTKIMARARLLRELRLARRERPVRSFGGKLATYFGKRRFGSKSWAKSQKSGIVRRRRMAKGIVSALLGSGMPQLPYRRPIQRPYIQPPQQFGRWVEDPYSQDLLNSLQKTAEAHQHVNTQNQLLLQRKELERQVKKQTSILGTPSLFGGHKIDINKTDPSMNILLAPNVFSQAGGSSLMTKEDPRNNILHAEKLRFGLIDPRQPQEPNLPSQQINYSEQQG